MTELQPTIRFNGETRALDGSRLDELLAAAGFVLERPGIAVALNGRLVRRADWSQTAVGDGDEVEVVGAVQGG